MAIVAGDLVKYLTGAASDGAAQTDPDLSLGGYHSATEPTSGSDNNLFDDVSGAEATAGHTDYRCLAYKNEHGSLALTSAKVYFSADDSNGDTTYSIAVERPETAHLTDGDAQTIANETTAPTSIDTTDHNGTGSGVSAWVASTVANDYAGGVAVDQGAAGTGLAVDDIIFIWIKRVIGSTASAAAAVSFTIRLEGDTAA